MQQTEQIIVSIIPETVSSELKNINDFRKDEFLRGTGFRTIKKKGVEVNGAFYFSPEMAGHERKRVKVLLDVADLGVVYLYIDHDGFLEFLCPAYNRLREGFDPKESSAIGKAIQNRIYKEGRKELKKLAREAGVDGIAEEILKFNERRIKNLVEFPRSSVDHTTPGLDEAAKAVKAIAERNKPQEPTVLSPEEETAAKRMLEKTEPLPDLDVIDARESFVEKQLRDAELSDWEKYDGWVRFEYLKKLSKLTKSQEKWIEYYKTTSEYRTLKEIYEDSQNIEMKM